MEWMGLEGMEWDGKGRKRKLEKNCKFEEFQSFFEAVMRSL